ncbi:hypothetical protein OCD79_05165 [Bacillus wiedmannii]|uniref:hypothetical protein n=1 Tax=Bacillus wiedmannii TaxID=1890302 RepID=UPI0021CE589D|nr:hypothetical protein [Bacillus wiedmannii]MCU5110926.1 hypothetical protein [Bacillus wiedmannii]MCU5150634.1 hypothetical protein [Bacillus wiedmannii]
MNALVSFLLNKLFNIGTNLSRIEKIENQHMLYKQKNLLNTLIIIFFLVLITGTAYYLYHYYRMHSYVLLFIYELISIPLYIIMMRRVGTSKLIVNIFGFLNFLIVLPLFLSISLMELFYSKFSYGNFLVAIIIITILYVIYYGIYFIINDLFSLKEVIQMTIILKNSEELVVNLISVTKRGDYIVEILNAARYENTEVLVNHSEIQKVILQLKQ